MDGRINPDYQRGWNDGYAAAVAASKTDAPRADVVAAAERIYAAYPRKVGKQAAVRVIAKALLRHDPDMIAAKVGEYAKAVATWPAEDRQFVPHPATWFNQGRWEDDPVNWRRVVKPVSQFSRSY